VKKLLGLLMALYGVPAAAAAVCGDGQPMTGPYDSALIAFAEAQGITHPEAFRNIVDAVHAAPDHWLPPCYVSERQAEHQGWHRGADLWEVLPQDAIGGMFYHNYNHLLPRAHDRHWIEADLDYEGGHRGAHRLIFARDMGDDWVFYVTTDHYEHFVRVPVGQ
jgi:hypothetical protein